MQIQAVGSVGTTSVFARNGDGLPNMSHFHSRHFALTVKPAGLDDLRIHDRLACNQDSGRAELPPSLKLMDPL